MATSDSNQSWAREQHRHHVLRLLGVNPLTARFDPPGARTPLRPVAPHEVLPEPPEPAARPAAVRPAGPVVSSAGLERSSVRVEPRPAPVPASEQDLSESERQPRATDAVAFQLLIATAGRWLWIEQLEDGLLRREQLQLIEAMARAITVEATTLNHFVFEWPLVQHAHLGRDAQSARDSVAGQLRRLAREQQVEGMILMGEACEEWVSVPSALSGLTIPGTLAMLANPGLKRDAWAILKPHAPTP